MEDLFLPASHGRPSCTYCHFWNNYQEKLLFLEETQEELFLEVAIMTRDESEGSKDIKIAKHFQAGTELDWPI